MNNTQRSTFFLLLLIVAFFNSCSSEKNAPLNRAYHNTTAHYNAYFYALAQITAIEEGIKASQPTDYDHILPIFPSIDSFTKILPEWYSSMILLASDNPKPQPLFLVV